MFGFLDQPTFAVEFELALFGQRINIIRSRFFQPSLVSSTLRIARAGFIENDRATIVLVHDGLFAADFEAGVIRARPPVAPRTRRRRFSRGQRVIASHHPQSRTTTANRDIRLLLSLIPSCAIYRFPAFFLFQFRRARILTRSFLFFFWGAAGGPPPPSHATAATARTVIERESTTSTSNVDRSCGNSAFAKVGR